MAKLFKEFEKNDGATRVNRAGPKEVLQRALEEIFNQGNLAVADELIDPDYANHDASPGQGRGPNGVKHVARRYRTAFPDLHLTVERMILEGDWVAVQVREKGTHRGVFEGIAPTGRHCNWMWIGIYRIAKGKLIERWGRIDTQELYEQLGYRLLTPGA